MASKPVKNPYEDARRKQHRPVKIIQTPIKTVTVPAKRKKK
jgi:hypothetical protein